MTPGHFVSRKSEDAPWRLPGWCLKAPRASGKPPCPIHRGETLIFSRKPKKPKTNRSELKHVKYTEIPQIHNDSLIKWKKRNWLDSSWGWKETSPFWQRKGGNQAFCLPACLVWTQPQCNHTVGYGKCLFRDANSKIIKKKKKRNCRRRSQHTNP